MNEANIVEILIVEDTPEDLDLALRALRKANLANRVHAARDGSRAGVMNIIRPRDKETIHLKLSLNTGRTT